jgi:hypothetical protein
MPSIKCIRERAQHYLTDDVAVYAAMSVSQMQQFIAGSIGHATSNSCSSLAGCT